jgi:hypothetical protein
MNIPIIVLDLVQDHSYVKIKLFMFLNPTIPKTIGFGLLTYSRGVVTKVSPGDWVRFSGSWNTDWDSKPISGSYDKTVTNYIDGVEMPTMFGGFNRTEKDIGKLSGDHSTDPNKPEQTSYAEVLLSKFYDSGDYDEPDITFFIDISSITSIND